MMQKFVKLFDRIKDVVCIIIHGGESHLDELIAVALLMAIRKIAGKEAIPVFRRDPNEQELKIKNVLVLDVGRIYDPEILCFDHHQRGREEEPKNAFRLFAEWLGLWNGLRKLMPWAETWNTVDVQGPFAVAKNLGIAPDTFFNVLGPYADIVSAMVEDPELEPLELGRVIMRYVAEPIIVKKVKAFNKMRAEMDRLEVGKIKIADFSRLAEEDVDATVIDLLCPDGVDIVQLPPNKRNKGITLLRWKDSPKVDFNNSPKDNCAFVHAGGFIAVIKEGSSWAQINEVINGSYTGKE